jgi:galactokinase
LTRADHIARKFRELYLREPAVIASATGRVNLIGEQFVPSVLVFDTGVSRSLRVSAFNERREECAHALTLLRQSTLRISLRLIQPRFAHRISRKL